MDNQTDNEKKEKTTRKSKKTDFYSGTGRRKRSVARVWLYEKKGDITINDKPASEVYPDSNDSLEWLKPFHAVGVSHPKAKFSASIKVSGGGTKGQLGAIRLGIARALIAYNPDFKGILRTTGLVTRDPREKERKKPFYVKARKKPQYSKR